MINPIIVRSLLVFVVLFAITLPFPLHYFPSLGMYLSNIFQPLNTWTAETIFGIDFQFIAVNESDSLGLYFHCIHLAVFSIFIGWTWNRWFHRFSENEIRSFLHASTAYILSFFLFKYGFDKLFKVQFYLPEPNTLYTPLGMLSKDILFWSTVGSSYSYSLFAGILEILPAILLLFRKTRLLGALIAFGVLIHVLLINFSFDISVKLLSSYLVGLSVILIQPYFSSLVSIFTSNSSEFKRPEFESQLPKHSRFQSLFRSFILSAILFESTFFFISNGIYNDDLVARPPFHGAYLVQKSKVISDSPSKLLGNNHAVKRIFIHRKGYLILQFTNDQFRDFPIRFHADRNSWTVQTDFKPLEWKIQFDQKHQTFHFHWNETHQNHTKQFELITKRIDLNQLPLLKPQFHWHVR